MIIIWSTFPAYKIKEILKFKFKLKPIHIILYVGGVVLFFAFALGLVKLLQLWLELPKTSMTKSLMERGGYSFAAVILMVCVQPALIEELAFRGIVYKALDNALKPRETILISAFLFAMLHLSLVSMFHLMLLGLFFGYIRYKTKSIWPSVLAHFLHNFGAVIVDKYNLF
jgi:membrane protease YdiL (CAAX protease family)